MHFSAIQGNGFRTRKEGQQVTYTEVSDQRGKKAENVEPVV
ncbi:MAG: cold-shock protein [Plesiomonas shigelloides]